MKEYNKIEEEHINKMFNIRIFIVGIGCGMTIGLTIALIIIGIN